MTVTLIEEMQMMMLVVLLSSREGQIAWMLIDKACETNKANIGEEYRSGQLRYMYESPLMSNLILL
jgi:hypothetical protein